MTYEVKDVQNVSVHTSNGDQSYLVVKVEYTDVDFLQTTTFELDPSLTDAEVTDVIVSAGKSLQSTKRSLNISGVIS